MGKRFNMTQNHLQLFTRFSVPGTVFTLQLSRHNKPNECIWQRVTAIPFYAHAYFLQFSSKSKLCNFPMIAKHGARLQIERAKTI